MLERLLTFSLKYRFLILIFTGLIVGAGIFSVREIAIDAVPDITSVQVQVITRTAPMGPVEVERYVTFPVEDRHERYSGRRRNPFDFPLRSLRGYGGFQRQYQYYFARQQVGERLLLAKEEYPRVSAPRNSDPSAPAWARSISLSSAAKSYSPMELRTILDWQIGYRLRSVPGVVEVNPIGRIRQAVSSRRRSGETGQLPLPYRPGIRSSGKK